MEPEKFENLTLNLELCNPPDVYPVGLLYDIRLRRIRRGLRMVRHWIRRRDFRAVRNYFRNGWLTEHQHPCHHNAGWGWSRRSSWRRAERACSKAGR